MPTYAYRCDHGHQFEAFQSITADALSKCQTCGAAVHRMVFPVGIVFKGQGFYKTDSRSSSSGSIAAVADKAPETTSKPEGAVAANGAAPRKAKKEVAPGAASLPGGALSAGEQHG